MILSEANIAVAHSGAATSADVSLDEKLGQSLPTDIAFTDESGKKIHLRKFIDKPTIIAPVYLSCMHVCPVLLNGLADVLGKMALVKPGKDYEVLAISFDEKDTPEMAADKKMNYLKAVGKPFPPESWKFLTGDGENIKKFTQSIGFTFQRDGEDFSHPLALIIVASDGKIIRYLYGTQFLPFEVTMALTEAAEGRVGSTTRKVLQYCFSYDALKKSYVFNILKVTGTVMVLFVAAFFAYLMISSKRKRGAS
ncbi:MAG: SCO family protein [bacterium]